MAIELKRYTQQVKPDTARIGGKLDSSLAQVAGQELAIPKLLADTLGEYAADYAEKKMKAIDQASQADYNNRVLALQSSIAQQVTDATGKVPFNEMYNKVVAPNLEAFEKSISRLGYSKPMTEKAINDFKVDKQQIANNEILQIEGIERDNIATGIKNGILDFLTINNLQNPDDIIVTPSIVTEKDIDNRIALKRSTAIANAPTNVMRVIEENREYDRSEIKKEVEESKKRNAERSQKRQRKDQLQLNKEFSEIKRDLANIIGENAAQLYVEEVIEAKANEKLDQIKKAGDSISINDRLNLVDNVVNQNKNELSPDVSEDIISKGQSLQLELMNEFTTSIKNDLNDLNDFIIGGMDNYEGYNEKVNDLLNKYNNPTLRKLILNRVNEQIEVETTAIRAIKDQTKTQKDIVKAFNFISRLRTGYDILKDKPNRNINLNEALEEISKLDKTAANFFLNALPTALQGMIDDNQAFVSTGKQVQDTNVGLRMYPYSIPIIPTGQNITFDEKGRDFLNEAYYYGRYSSNLAEFLVDSLEGYLKFLRENPDGNEEEYAKFKKKYFNKSIDNILTSPLINDSMNMFTAPEIDFSEEELNLIKRVMK
jgi:archaellum component FlaC